MFGFSVLAVPLSYLSLSAWFFPRSGEEKLARYFGRGLAFALLGLLIHSLLYGIIPELYGSFLYTFRIWWERFLLPFGLAVGFYRLMHRFSETVRSQEAMRRYTAFLFGFFSVFCANFALRSTGLPNIYSVVFFPVLSMAGIMATVYLTKRAAAEAGIFRVLWTLLILAIGFGLACVAYLFYARMEWLGGILSLAALGVSGYLGLSVLK